MRNRIEQRIFDEADKLTPEPPDFSQIEKSVDWERVAEMCRGKKKKRIWRAPLIVGATACLVAAITIPVVIYFANKSTDVPTQENRPVLYGTFVVSRWVCSDSTKDFSGATMKIDSGEKTEPTGYEISDMRPATELTPGTVYLKQRSGTVAFASFSGEFFSTFQFDSCFLNGASYTGEAIQGDEAFPFSIMFPVASASEKSVEVSFGSETTSVSGTAFFKTT